MPTIKLSASSNASCMRTTNHDALSTTNMCSHLQRKLFVPDGEYHAIWQQIESDPTLTAVVRSRQLHIYRNGKKVLILAGKAAPKILADDEINPLLPSKT